jgi:hypothetical protein
MRYHPKEPEIPEELIGRSEVIQKLWSILSLSSVVLTGQRGIGKTAILRQMSTKPRPGFRVLYLDLAGVSDVQDFVVSLIRSTDDLKVDRNISERFRGLGHFSGIGQIRRVEPIRPNWRQNIELSLQWFSKGSSEISVICFDEFSRLLQASQVDAAFLLDLLRRIRMEQEQLRMVFCSSSGTGYLLQKIAKYDNPHSPLNDTHIVEIPPLSVADSIELSKRLLTKKSVAVAPHVPKTIAELTDGVPAYNKVLVHEMSRLGAYTPLRHEDVRRAYWNALTDDSDPFELGDFATRMDDYYHGVDGQVARNLLDSLAFIDGPFNRIELAQLLAKKGIEDRERILSATQMLVQDGYLKSDPDGTLGFRHPFLREWWKRYRNRESRAT